jgi:hypothetical protein
LLVVVEVVEEMVLMTTHLEAVVRVDFSKQPFQ